VKGGNVMCLGMINGCRSDKNKYVYIIGDTNTPESRKNFEVIKHLLMGDDYIVLSYVDVMNALPELAYDGEMHIHYALIDLCNEIYVMKDWESSDKAILDFRYAVGMSKKIRYEE
jgi:transposase